MIDILVDEELAGTFAVPAGIEQAVIATCRLAGQAASQPQLCVRFAADDAVHELNRQWRGKDQVTDVLSFPMQEGPLFDFEQPLGDIALAVPFIQQEAARLELAESAHGLHLIVHATLHLLGYDHINDQDAAEMQLLEKKIMAEIGLHNPYPVDESESI